jgi:hypothetical protein
MHHQSDYEPDGRPRTLRDLSVVQVVQRVLIAVHQAAAPKSKGLQLTRQVSPVLEPRLRTCGTEKYRSGGGSEHRWERRGRCRQVLPFDTPSISRRAMHKWPR